MYMCFEWNGSLTLHTSDAYCNNDALYFHTGSLQKENHEAADILYQRILIYYIAIAGCIDASR